jgi:hypothetical protein
VAWAVWLVETDVVASGNESDGLFAGRSIGDGLGQISWQVLVRGP